jgi:hypothetical protein
LGGFDLYLWGGVMADEPEIVTTDDARAGQTPHIVRYMLLISLILIVVAFAALLIIWR